jgi:methylmalonyl-CoA mutase N-terminal domain/subunit
MLCCAEAEVVPVRQIDNSAVLSAQLTRLASVKQARDGTAVAAALQVNLI